MLALICHWYESTATVSSASGPRAAALHNMSCCRSTTTSAPDSAEGGGAVRQKLRMLLLPLVALSPPGLPAPLQTEPLSQPLPTLLLSTYRQTS